MTDRDQSLQDAFDRHFRKEGPPPDTGDDPEAAAYQMVYAALHEEPDGELSPHFAERVVRRIGLTADPVLKWFDVLLLLLGLAGFGASLVAYPSVYASLVEGLFTSMHSFLDLSMVLRLDVVLATSFVLVLTLLVDRFLTHWPPRRRVFPT